MTCFRSYLRPRLLAIAAVLVAATVPARADSIDVSVDQATLIKLPDRVATIVVGNPLIADVTAQPGSTLVVTGKGFGSTNLVALDRSGNVLLEKMIRVAGPREQTLVVWRGVARQTYSCQPDCAPRITLGDNPAFFTETLGQSVARNAQAQGAAGPPIR